MAEGVLPIETLDGGGGCCMLAEDIFGEPPPVVAGKALPEIVELEPPLPRLAA